jgi:integrase
MCDPAGCRALLRLCVVVHGLIFVPFFAPGALGAILAYEHRSGLAHLGWTPKRVQTVMGHSSIQMTFDLYGHLFEDREGDREAMKKLEAAIVAA